MVGWAIVGLLVPQFNPGKRLQYSDSVDGPTGPGSGCRHGRTVKPALVRNGDLFFFAHVVIPERFVPQMDLEQYTTFFRRFLTLCRYENSLFFIPLIRGPSDSTLLRQERERVYLSIRSRNAGKC